VRKCRSPIWPTRPVPPGSAAAARHCAPQAAAMRPMPQVRFPCCCRALRTSLHDILDHHAPRMGPPLSISVNGQLHVATFHLALAAPSCSRARGSPHFFGWRLRDARAPKAPVIRAPARIRSAPSTAPHAHDVCCRGCLRERNDHEKQRFYTGFSVGNGESVRAYQAVG